MNANSLTDALRALPDVDAPPAAWQQIEQRLGHRAATSQWLFPVATAASLVIALVLGIVLRPEPGTNPMDPELSRLISASQVFERRLSTAPSSSSSL